MLPMNAPDNTRNAFFANFPGLLRFPSELQKVKSGQNGFVTSSRGMKIDFLLMRSVFERFVQLLEMTLRSALADPPELI